MSDFGHYGGSEEEYATVRKHNAEVEANPDSFENWENLVKACETLEGGLNRNSSPQALATFRDAYDRFLLKFPLLFGYWKKYADMEFNIAGPESAEMVYERGVASITNSVDLWTEYCSFKMETTHDPHLVRELFERGTACVGLDFLAHPFWDKYLEYEERQEAHDRIFAIHARIIRIPMHQYARYYERFRTLAHSRPLAEVAPADAVARFRAEVESEAAAYGGAPRPELEVERDIRAKIDTMYYDVFTATQNEVSKRWTYESEIKRPYFHVTELEHQQLANWRKYLDFEEADGDYTRIVCLYERCLTTCALYDEFWFRYARWMSAQAGKQEEVRNIYIRAGTMFVPVSRPGIRLQWAYFEESTGRVDVAADIHAAILHKIPDCVEVIVSWANLERRQKGVEAAIQVYRDQIDTPTVDLYTKAALVSEWAYLLWKTKGATEEARAIFLKNVQWYADSRMFWERWFKLELEQPSSEANQGQRVKHVFDELRNQSRLSPAVKKELSQVYLDYLVQSGGKDAMKLFVEVDREMFGPPSIATVSKIGDGAKENGASRGELDDAAKQKAEAKRLNFFELHGEPNDTAQGPADFH
ncbi:Pre-mRNA-processing factor-like protein [Hapsidospora chrysogenum ATCC 11550]|uniref:Pre-mRNA-processing factor-like protein n=1 Tax=Hapsidospora chrysogenum (strain ATCC 11550 / CBS 779.69 / DSM 880 / IAM 14645 / JCM 23072 / IMI 49137) TaxID=857340 RepID=A0A086T8V0_HAPC1|nr:Pre-mRNA-processing factor-like protein [Hapsidospora chrysogenum ATCC 11550]